MPRGRMGGQTDMNLVVVFDHFAKAPKGDDVVMNGLHDSLHSAANSAESEEHCASAAFSALIRASVQCTDFYLF